MITEQARAHRSADTPTIFESIRDPDCSLAIWQRAPFADFKPLIAGTPRDLRFVSDLLQLADTLAHELQSNGYGGDATLRRILIGDITRLARLFCGALDLTQLELRLEVVRTDSCRKFHADCVTARLITTYVGVGTDWLDNANAERVAAGAEPKHVNRLNPFDVGLFKGKLATDRPAIHRSPPISGTGEVRLLMVLNPAFRPPQSAQQSPLSQPPYLA